MPTAYVVAGLAYGDEGKGSIVDALCREHGAKMVVRYNGGANCGHNVCLSDGRHHTFSQFGSGTFAGAGTYFSRFALLEPYALFNEAEVLAESLGEDPLAGFVVEEGAVVITPFHWIANRAKENHRGARRHGSTGMGLGEARADQIGGVETLQVRDLACLNPARLRAKLYRIRALKAAELALMGADTSTLFAESVEDIIEFYLTAWTVIRTVPDGALESFLEINSPLVFEGAQGVLLDETFGRAPFNTWTDTTFANADQILDGMDLERIHIGVLRTYATRHGAGPFVTECPCVDHPELHNGTHPWQGKFRQGHFDMSAAAYAIKCCGGVDMLALTHLDRVTECFDYAIAVKSGLDAFSYLPKLIRTCHDTGLEAQAAAIGAIEQGLGCHVGITSYGPLAGDKRFR